MASLFCSFVTFSKEKCNISPRYPEVAEYFSLTSCKRDIRSHLRTVKVSQTSILTEKDLILARTGQFNEDGTNMTICPRHRAEHGTFWRPSRKCAHPLHGNSKGEPERERHWTRVKKSWQSGTRSFQSEQVREENIVVYRILKFHNAPLVQT